VETIIWHKHIGEINYQTLHAISQINHSKGMPYIPTISQFCDECVLGKEHKEHVPKVSVNRATARNELIHSDMCGPFTHTSFGGSKYFVTFIDYFSKKNWIFFLQKKSGAFAKFKILKQVVENAKEKKIKVLKNDHGREFLSNEFKTFCENHGIKK
jgi:hypothetical protein